MSVIWRRIAVLSAGVAVLALQAAAPRAAKAGGFVNTQSACIDLGGNPVWNNEVNKYWCETPQWDEECKRINPAYDKDGLPYDWYYNVSTRKCEESGCFLTSACAGRIGLADDCFELSVLRRFRDNVLAQMPGGADDIALYYRHAPEIVARIARSAAPSDELARLYARYILPSALAAWLGFDRTARRIYSAMMRDLAARYGIALA
ncbi:MAG TPA: CFI-box-CTERM domain-containing protein [Xanthobacteraceae bacterium]|nr:CFI-box-CTERM domain-containing protein [Xanthobacteraceae bacterium]